jgi:hypothetical protein
MPRLLRSRLIEKACTDDPCRMTSSEASRSDTLGLASLEQSFESVHSTSRRMVFS